MLKMGILALATKLVLVASVFSQESTRHVTDSHMQVENNLVDSSELVLAFVVFRHGDRTPDPEEIDLYPASRLISRDIYFPYGKKALTNTGKVRGFRVGQYLRRRYDGFISHLYLSHEVGMRTTDYDRSKMTALSVLAGLYPPVPSQRWNPDLDWQPVPYSTTPSQEDDLMYWNCGRYIKLRDQVYERPEVKKYLFSYQNLFTYLSDHTLTNITTPEDVYYLDNLFQSLESVGIEPPKFAQEVMPKIKAIMKIEYAIEFFNPELIRFSTGVLFGEILNVTDAAINGQVIAPRLRLYSAHENNVAALMAAAKVFEPHQPNCGATFSLELRKTHFGQYGIVAVYAPVAGGPEQVLPIAGCGAGLCDYDTFKRLTKDHTWTREAFQAECHS